jgi:multidrug resistance efflux pump
MTQRNPAAPELPAPPGRILLFATLALMAGSGVAYSLRCPRLPQCAGYLSARTTHVICDREGTLAEFSVQAGDQVSLETPLVILSDRTLSESIARKEQEIATLQSELDRCLAESELELDWRLRTLNTEICEIQLKSASYLKERYNYDLRRAMLSDVLQGDSFVMNDGADALYESIVLGQHLPSAERAATMMELEVAANSADVSEAQVEICDTQIKFLNELRGKLPEQIQRSTGVDVAEARVSQAEAELEELLGQETGLTILSPALGKVGVFQVKRGDHLRPGTPIVELLDASQRFIVAHVPSQQITYYTINTRVTLEFPGDQFCEGRVYSIAPQAEPQANVPVVIGHDAPIAVHIEQVGEAWPELPMGSRVAVQLQE